jgi:hypothetical protein
MEALFILIVVAALALSAFAYWSLYQFTLAAWNSRRAGPKWRGILSSTASVFPFILPIAKWLLPVAGIAFVAALVVEVVR